MREIRHDKVALNLVKIPSLSVTVWIIHSGFLFSNRIIYDVAVKRKLLYNSPDRKLTCTALLYVSCVLMALERSAGKSIDSLHVRFHHFPFGVKSRSPFKWSINGRAAFCAQTTLLTVC